MAEYAAYAALFFAALILLFLLLRHARFRMTSGGAVREDAPAARPLARCPLCKSALRAGEDLVSRVYRPMNVPDQLCTINGCPHCFPVPEPGIRRACPVCHADVPVQGGHLAARLFNKPDGKKHVVVTGCTRCCRHGAAGRLHEKNGNFF